MCAKNKSVPAFLPGRSSFLRSAVCSLRHRCSGPLRATPVELRTTSGQFSSDIPVTHTKDAPWEFQTVSGDVTITTVK